jgi:myo-inositol-1(or 4)-monophosphatase
VNGLEREAEAARNAAIKAGEIIAHYYRSDSYFVDSKGKDDPVTSADIEADHAIKEFLRTEFPNDGWLSEETTDDTERLTRRRVWIVDPLDGTREFIAQVPEFCVAIALVENCEPVIGVIYNPIKEELYWSARGLGCYRGMNRVGVTHTSILQQATVLASRSEVARGDWDEDREMMHVRATGSVAYKLAIVAAGGADGTFTRSPKNEWDIAAGAALISEAGGLITDLDCRPLRFNQAKTRTDGLIASSATLFPALSILARLRLSPVGS